MVVDKFISEASFPFSDYFQNLDQYLFAQRYWYLVLLEASNFNASDWCPLLGPVDIKSLQNDGKMYQILNKSLRKEIYLYMRSFKGVVNLTMKDNDGMDLDEIEEAINKWKFTPSASEIAGYTWQDAEEEVRDDYKPYQIWVEKSYYFQDLHDHPEGGQEIPTERLILNSEISEEAEPKALHALELFLEDGPATDRVNSVFAPDDE